jgi:hypothetical protein
MVTTLEIFFFSEATLTSPYGSCPYNAQRINNRYVLYHDHRQIYAHYILRMISALYRAVAESATSMDSMGNIPFPLHQPDDGDDDSVIFDITSEEFCSDEFRMYDFKVC